MQDRGGQYPAQRPQRPVRPGEDTMVGADVPANHRSHDAIDRGNGVLALHQDGPDHQGQNSLESRLGICYRKTHEKRLRRRWKRIHNGLLSDSITLYRNKNRQESIFCANNSLSIDNLKKMAKVEVRGP